MGSPTELSEAVHLDMAVNHLTKHLNVNASRLLQEYQIKYENKTKSFHALIKREWLNRFKIRDYRQAYHLIFEYIETFYNTKRIHSHCDFMSPNDFEKLYEQTQSNQLLLIS